MKPSRAPEPPQQKPISKAWNWLAIGAGLVFLVVLAGAPIRDWWAGKELEKELKLARAEGIITTLEEMKAYGGPPPPEEENAYPILMEIDRLPKVSQETGRILPSRSWMGSNRDAEPSVRQLRLAVEELTPVLLKGEKCAEMPSLWQESDWSLGQARPLHYYGPVRRAAGAFMVRAELAGLEGQEKEAIADLRRVVKLSELALGVKDGSGFYLGCWLREDVEDKLIKWAAAAPAGSVWMKELEQVWARQKISEPETLLKPLLYEWLATMDLLQTPEGQKQVGVRTWDSKTVQYGNWDELQTLNEGKLRMVKAFRGIWREVFEDWPESLSRTYPHEEEFVKGALSDPYAATPFFIEDGGEAWPHHAQASVLDRRILVQAAIRLLKSPDRDETASMNGLVSPLDGSKVMIKREVTGGKNQWTKEVEPVRTWLRLSFEGQNYDGLKIPLPTKGKGRQ
jgi:hypothetical protein